MAAHSWDELAQLSVDVPDALARRAESHDSAVPPAVPQPSASVILIRDTEAGLETYLLHRHAKMPFAANMVVFPGGRVDPDDARQGLDPIRACALRETAEETSVQLADHHLHAWAHWITPEIEPRRYDTHFFVAPMPPFQHARDISGETDRARWTTPSEALRAEAAGTIGLMPPTLSILLELAAAGSVDEVLTAAEGRIVDVVVPELEPAGAGWVFRYPGGVSRA